ncbi:hypothetical protein BO78DRAFT_146447 [Aspergillus sclerotiicarbonarius CBS 121057]|uniref:Uncharacterized protein n=1 Tax=Aspergillus sclerotiicarbonarius (strain CBS 121057 / IBT 28362) TaxID=1448318 RepID=A0A319E659_ASPSB|nr:hypothetical protein BO78DRAFT_146447 [Aspergillus sclerotiicarbonarius CBS 121057]
MYYAAFSLVSLVSCVSPPRIRHTGMVRTEKSQCRVDHGRIASGAWSRFAHSPSPNFHGIRHSPFKLGLILKTGAQTSGPAADFSQITCTVDGADTGQRIEVST